MAESTKISSLTRGIPKFDGNALKYEEWKTVTLAVLEISRNDMFEILTGESARPREVYTSPARTDTQNAPVSSGEAADGDSEQAGASSSCCTLLKKQIYTQKKATTTAVHNRNHHTHVYTQNDYPFDAVHIFFEFLNRSGGC